MTLEVIDALHAARLAGDLAGMCRLFADQGEFEIRGASADKPIAITAHGIGEFRPWLAMMVKVFRLTGYTRLSVVQEPPRAAVRWRTDIHSKVTGITVATDLIDLIEVRAGRIVQYSEFFVPR